MMSNPDMEKRVQGLIRKVLLEARRVISGDIKAGDAMKSDPRQAYKAVKSAVYKRILGGSVSILAKKRAGKRLEEPPIYHALEHRVNSKGNHRGGNRAPRSQRTKDLMTYAGPDRGFILRFVNDGTGDRTINFRSDSRRERVNRGSRGGNVNKYGKTVNTGLRGKIAPRQFFGPSAQRWVQQAADNLTRLIYQEVQNIINEK